MRRIAHATLPIATAAVYMGIGAVVTLIVQGNHQAASDLLWTITATGGAATAICCLTWATIRWAKRHRSDHAP